MKIDKHSHGFGSSCRAHTGVAWGAYGSYGELLAPAASDRFPSSHQEAPRTSLDPERRCSRCTPTLMAAFRGTEAAADGAGAIGNGLFPGAARSAGAREASTERPGFDPRQPPTHRNDVDGVTHGIHLAVVGRLLLVDMEKVGRGRSKS